MGVVTLVSNVTKLTVLNTVTTGTYGQRILQLALVLRQPHKFLHELRVYYTLP